MLIYYYLAIYLSSAPDLKVISEQWDITIGKKKPRNFGVLHMNND